MPKKIAYLNAFSGLSGNMILGALIDAGFPINELVDGINLLCITGYSLKHEKVNKQGILSTYIDVETHETHHHHHTSFTEIRQIIMASNLPAVVKENSVSIFLTLAQAESEAHGVTIDEVHFHEVGAVDAIIDITGSSLGFYTLGIDEIYCSPIALGGGTVKCEHGLLPVPAPATARILSGVPSYGGPVEFELTTPTGAAIVKTLASGFGFIPPMTIESTSFGAGSKQFEHPNVLEMIIGTQSEVSAIYEQMAIIETTIDDMTGEDMGFLIEQLQKEGAKEIYITQIQMKKNRPGVQLTVLCQPSIMQNLGEFILKNSTTRGYRYRIENRLSLPYIIETSETRYGPVRFKINQIESNLLKIKPEFEDIKLIAERTGLPVDEIRKSVVDDYHKDHAK